MSLIKLTANKPTLLLDPNPRRKKVLIQMQAKAVDSNNTGKVYVGFGFQPVAIVGNPNQGEVLIQSAYIEKPRTGEKLEEREKDAVWATSDTDNQTLIVEEEVEEE